MALVSCDELKIMNDSTMLCIKLLIAQLNCKGFPSLLSTRAGLDYKFKVISRLLYYLLKLRANKDSLECCHEFNLHYWMFEKQSLSESSNSWDLEKAWKKSAWLAVEETDNRRFLLQVLKFNASALRKADNGCGLKTCSPEICSTLCK